MIPLLISLSIVRILPRECTVRYTPRLKVIVKFNFNKTKVIRTDLLDFAFDFNFFYFEDIIRFGNTSVLVTFQF